MEIKLQDAKVKHDAKEQLRELLPWVSQALKLGEQEIQALQHSLAAEIIVATAYLSGCRNPVRIAVTHLCTLLNASSRITELYDHTQAESLKERIECIDHFPGGNPQAVAAGILLLELLSLNDHKMDIADDILTGAQNPLIIDLDYATEKERILAEYRKLNQDVLRIFEGLYSKVIKAGIWWG